MARYLIVFSTLILAAFAFPSLHKEKTKTYFSGKERIVGGTDAPEGSFSYMASLRYTNDSHFCGASIIDSTTILTALHCIRHLQQPSEVIVVVGTHELNTGGETYKVSTIISHTQNDIALLKLTTPIQYSETVSPVDLEMENISDDAECVLSGWGLTRFDGSTPNHLQYVKLKTISTSECQKYFGPYIQESEVCTLTKVGEGACQGDSGGPLVANNKQIGIVSYGFPCAEGYPDVYTRVSYFIDWIKQNS